MRKTALLLLISILCLLVVSSMAQPLTATATYKFSFKPVLVPVEVAEGYVDGNSIYSPVYQFQYGLKVINSSP